MTRQSSTAVTKATMLAAAVDYAASNGLGDVSLRQMASAVGTSHRMLIYHFGSKEGLLVAVINEVERRQLEQLSKLDTDPNLSAADQLRLMWRRLSDPKMWPHERLFFEVYGQALQGRAHTTHLLDGVVESWLTPATASAVRHGLPKRVARANARLALAVMRGLLLDLLATGDRKGCTEAMEAFIATSAFAPLRSGVDSAHM